MFRRSLATGGDVLDLGLAAPGPPATALVGHLRHLGLDGAPRPVLLRFSQALAGSAVRTEAFVFGTKLTRVTRLLRDRDRDRALDRVADPSTDWSGGTRIGESFREFNQRLGATGAPEQRVVVVVSDGWDRGDPALVAARPPGSSGAAIGSSGSTRSRRPRATSRWPVGCRRRCRSSTTSSRPARWPASSGSGPPVGRTDPP